MTAPEPSLELPEAAHRRATRPGRPRRCTFQPPFTLDAACPRGSAKNQKRGPVISGPSTGGGVLLLEDPLRPSLEEEVLISRPCVQAISIFVLKKPNKSTRNRFRGVADPRVPTTLATSLTSPPNPEGLRLAKPPTSDDARRIGAGGGRSSSAAPVRGGSVLTHLGDGGAAPRRAASPVARRNAHDHVECSGRGAAEPASGTALFNRWSQVRSREGIRGLHGVRPIRCSGGTLRPHRIQLVTRGIRAARKPGPGGICCFRFPRRLQGAVRG